MSRPNLLPKPFPLQIPERWARHEVEDALVILKIVQRYGV